MLIVVLGGGVLCCRGVSFLVGGLFGNGGRVLLLGDYYKVVVSAPVIVLGCGACLRSDNVGTLRLTGSLRDTTGRSKVAVITTPRTTSVCELDRRASLPVFTRRVSPITPNKRANSGLVDALISTKVDKALVGRSRGEVGLTSVTRIVGLYGSFRVRSYMYAGGVRASGTITTLGPITITIRPPRLVKAKVPMSRTRPRIIRSAIGRIGGVGGGVGILYNTKVAANSSVGTTVSLNTSNMLLTSNVVGTRGPGSTLLSLMDGF